MGGCALRLAVDRCARRDRLPFKSTAALAMALAAINNALPVPDPSAAAIIDVAFQLKATDPQSVRDPLVHGVGGGGRRKGAQERVPRIPRERWGAVPASWRRRRRRRRRRVGGLAETGGGGRSGWPTAVELPKLRLGGAAGGLRMDELGRTPWPTA